MTEQNSEAEYLSDEHDEVENVLPKKLTVWLAIIFGLCALASLALIIFYALRRDAKPSELNLGTVLIYCLTALVIVLIPWKKLGLRLKKLGFVEFERVIKTQKKEQIVDIVSLQKQIDQLKGIPPIGTGPVGERAVEPMAGTPRDVKRNGERESLLGLLQKFLQHYSRYYFSPSRIKFWGATRDGFHELDSYSKEEISQGLQHLLVANKVRTKISKKGNTLYGINPRY